MIKEENKVIEREISRKAFLFEISIDIDEKPFITDINNFIKEKNLNYSTNVKGGMTDWYAFMEHEKFLNILGTCCSYLGKYANLNKASLKEAWGIKIEPGDYTDKHNHAASVLSGILYLNDVDQNLIFPDLSITVKPRKGTFLLFSPWLDHMTDVNKTNTTKYAIPFNFQEYKHKDWS
jgi:hypothetical protein